MNKLERYLQEQDRIIREDREKTLIALGLTEKEYGNSWQHTQWDFIDGEKRYYREIAIEVTDEEYALILSKARQVAEINEKEERERRDSLSAHKTLTKKWIPVFTGSSDDNTGSAKTGKSRAAKNLRTCYYISIAIAAVYALYCVIAENADFGLLVSALTAGFVGWLFIEALASILDYLAEMTAILRNGFRYNESSTPKKNTQKASDSVKQKHL